MSWQEEVRELAKKIRWFACSKDCAHEDCVVARRSATILERLADNDFDTEHELRVTETAIAVYRERVAKGE